MTVNQDMAIWEMWRQGLHQLAYLAEQRWERGEQVQRDDVPQALHLVWTLVEQGNRQIQ